MAYRKRMSKRASRKLFRRTSRVRSRGNRSTTRLGIKRGGMRF